MKWKTYEDKWQKRWDEQRTFVPKARNAPGQKKFFITVPYPYTSGALHIGHGRTYTLGDVIARFKRLQGFNVLFPMAFHISGSPILSISEKIKKEDTKTLALYREYLRIYEGDDHPKISKILESFKEPKNVANYFADKIQIDFKSIGYSIDWTRKFNTGMPRYNKFIEWQFTKLKEKGVLVKGKYPILWSIDGDQPVGEDDIVDGDTNKVSINEFTGLYFESEFGFFIAATLRPETVFGATNIWLNPDKYYVVVDVGKERWVVSENAVKKLKIQGKKVKILKREKGKYFIGGSVKTPTGKTVPILPADFVDPKNGTGVVYSVPAHAPYDYMALVDLKYHEKWGKVVDSIEPIVIIDIPGYGIPAKEICEQMGIRNQKDSQLEEATKEIYKAEYYSGVLNDKCEQFSGIAIHTIKNEVKNELIKKGKAVLFYETSRPAITRTGSPVAVAVLDNQWFIDYSDKKWKDQTRRHLESMLIYPDKFRKLFLDTVDWLDKRPCARRKGLGTKFPFDKDWVIESLSDSTIYMAFYIIVPYLNKIKPEKLTTDVFDFLLLGKGNINKIAEKTGLSVDMLKQARADFEYWYPNDHRHTAPAHISNHLSFFIMHHLAIFPEAAWPKGISLNEMLIREGMKMSKSKGNVIPLNHVKKKYGADLYRLYVTSSADMDAVVDWREKDVSAVQRKLEKFIEILDACESVQERPVNDSSDKWILSRFYNSLNSAIEMMSEFRFREALIEIFFKMLNDVRWFERRNSQPYGILRTIIKDWLIILSPVIPHTAEEYWERFGGNGLISTARLPKVRKDLIDNKAEKQEAFIQNILEDIRNMIKMAEKTPKTIYLYTAPEWKWQALELVSKEKSNALKKIKKFKNPAEAAKIISSFVKNRVWEIEDQSKIDEVSLIKEADKILKSEFGAEIKVNESYDPMKKAVKAMPFRPAIYIE